MEKSAKEVKVMEEGTTMIDSAGEKGGGAWEGKPFDKGKR